METCIRGVRHGPLDGVELAVWIGWSQWERVTEPPIDIGFFLICLRGLVGSPAEPVGFFFCRVHPP